MRIGGLLSAVIGKTLDPLSAMLDPSLPLAIEEERSGATRQLPGDARAMLRYSPYEGLQTAVSYPALMLVAAQAT